MTQPVQEPSQGRQNQSQDWRTRQLFRRPASPVPPAGGPISATAVSGQYSRTNVARLVQYFTDFWTNDPDNTDGTDGSYFRYSDTNTSHQFGAPYTDFTYIALQQSGFYLAEYAISFSSAYAAEVYIEATCISGGSWDDFISFIAPQWSSLTGGGGGFDSISSDLYVAANQATKMIEGHVYFNHDPNVDGENPLKIGVNLYNTSPSGSKSVGSQLAVTRLGDLMTETWLGP